MRRKIRNIARYVFLISVSFLSVFPLYWMAVSATNTSVEVIAGKLVPGTYLFENMKLLFESQNVQQAFWNSLRNATILTISTLLVCSIAGYGFEIYHDRIKDIVFSILLLAMMVPFAATMIPLFQMFSNMNLLDSTMGFILPTISTPFMIMLFRQNTRSFPHDIIEAARIDGLNEIAIFFKVFVPTMIPTYAVAMTIVFMNAWNNYLWPKVIMLSDDGVTMPMMVANLITGYVIDYGVLMLGVLLCTIPTVIVFFLLQKSFVAGITGAVKG